MGSVPFISMAQADNPFGTGDWSALQRQYLDALKALGMPGAVPGTSSAPSANPWQGALDYWWQGATAALPPEQRGLFNDVVRQSRAFQSCAGFFAPLADVLSQPRPGDADWERELRRCFDTLQAQLEAGAVAPGMEALLGAWTLPPDFREQSSALMARLPDEWLRALPMTNPLPGQRAEFSESLRDGARLWQACQAAQADYLRLLSGAARDGLERMQERLRAGATVHTLRELYDLWVDCGEAAIGERMAGAEFAASFAALVNALSAFRVHTRGVLDAALAALAMPTAAALGSVQQREAGLRSELRAAQARQREDRAQLERLQRELETLRRDDAGR